MADAATGILATLLAYQTTMILCAPDPWLLAIRARFSVVSEQGRKLVSRNCSSSESLLSLLSLPPKSEASPRAYGDLVIRRVGKPPHPVVCRVG